jgi:hypothetical protein
MATAFTNPFRPGAGHRPPYLAGRKAEQQEFRKLLKQRVVTDNLVLTGLRGVGKTVLLEEFKAIALSQDWLWVGTDLSESASISETSLAQRLIADLSVVTSGISIPIGQRNAIGFSAVNDKLVMTLGFESLWAVYQRTPGLNVDKLKAVFSLVARYIPANKQGIAFAYDEAQNLADHSAKEQYPLSMLLDLFQSAQRGGVKFLLVLSGLPTLFPKLVEARTYSERMFRVLFLRQLNEEETREAIVRPVKDSECPVHFTASAIGAITRLSGGYPYFIQFICRETYDTYLQRINEGRAPTVPLEEILIKLDTDFFAGRWAKVTDRQQELLFVISQLGTANSEFTVQEILTQAQRMLVKPFSRSHINQMLSSLIEAGLVYRDRHGKYLFAVPLMADFIKRVMKDSPLLALEPPENRARAE